MSSNAQNRLEVLMDDDTERRRQKEQAERYRRLQQEAQKKRQTMPAPPDDNEVEAEKLEEDAPLPFLTGTALPRRGDDGLPRRGDDGLPRGGNPCGGSESAVPPVQSTMLSSQPSPSRSAPARRPRSDNRHDGPYDPLEAFPTTLEQLDRLDKTFGRSSTRDALRRKIEARQSTATAQPAVVRTPIIAPHPASVPSTAGMARPAMVPKRPGWKSVLPHIVRVAGDEKRVAVWEKEGWGTNPAEEGRDVGEWTYRRLEDYPEGLSDDLLGGRKCKNNKQVFTSTRIKMDDIQRLLLMGDTPHVFKAFKDYAKSLIVAGDCLYKYGPLKTPKEEQEPYLRRWEDRVVQKLTKWKHLPPSVAEECNYPPKEKATGFVLWTQKMRCYWHMMDKMALLVAINVREERKIALAESAEASKRLPSWQPQY